MIPLPRIPHSQSHKHKGSGPLQSNDYDCGIFICLFAAFLDIRLPLSFSQHDTRNVRAWMAHEMIEEGKLLKMIHRVLHDSLLASATGNSAPTSDNSTAISRSTTDTVVTTTRDQQQSKRSSQSQLQGAIKRQRTYEPEAGEEEKNVQATAEFWAVMRATHGFQNQAAPANAVTPSTEPGTSSRQQEEVSLKNHRKPKRRRGSDNEYTDPTTTTTPLGDIDTLKDAPTSQPNTKRCIQVGRETYVVTSQPGTPYTFDPRIDAETILGQRI